MNILLLSNHCNTGGITSYLLTLAKGLKRRGHSVWLASSGGNCVHLFESAGVEHVQVNIKVKNEFHPKVLAAGPTLWNLVRSKGIDIIHANTRVTQVAGTIASSLCAVPLVSTCHGFFKLRLFRRLFPCWGQGVIAISRPVQEHLIKDFKCANNIVHLITNGIDLESFPITTAELRHKAKEDWGVSSAKTIGIIARLSDVKGIDVLVQAMTIVSQRLSDARLIVVGEGPEETALKALVQERNLQSKVFFKSITNRSVDVLPCFDVFVMPSRQEGLGLAVMEAQAVGIPVVVSNVGGLPDLVDDRRTGLLANPGDFKMLAEKIIDSLEHPEQAQLMAKAARIQIEKDFSADTMVNETIKVYEQYTCR